MLPWTIGFLLFLLAPILASLFLAFTKFDGLNSPVFLSFDNFVEMFFADPMFKQSLKVTLLFAVVYLPLSTVTAIAMALVLNQKIVGQSVYRTLLYLPTVVPIVASSVVWLWIFKADSSGLLNSMLEPLLSVFGLDLPMWFADPQWALPALVIMSLWTVGNPMLIYLAGLQNISDSLYEAAELDGASSWTQLWHITLPLLSPTIFFNVTIALIQVFQYFVPAYVMTSGGPQASTLFYSLYTYQLAFDDFRFGYASALAWVLFLIVFVATLFAFYVSRKTVHYEVA